jgi:hypothetical protein
LLGRDSLVMFNSAKPTKCQVGIPILSSTGDNFFGQKWWESLFSIKVSVYPSKYSKKYVYLPQKNTPIFQGVIIIGRGLLYQQWCIGQGVNDCVIGNYIWNRGLSGVFETFYSSHARLVCP